MIQLPDNFPDTLPISDSEKQLLLQSLNDSPPISVRLNPYKFHSDLPLEKVKWCFNGYYLPERPVFTFDPLFHSGAYYVQEASSMIIGEIAKEIISKNEIKIALDLCASPGGKSTHLLSVLPDNSLLICNEVVSARLAALSENVTRWGNNNVCVTNNEPSHFSSLENLFDLILVDAPCSGEGMFRKEEAALTEWSLKNVEMCAARQKNILEDVLPSLKPGGFLIYSTCTYNEKENEENVKFLLENYQMETYPVSAGDFISSPFESNASSFRFFPHKTKGEGLFVSVFRKKDSDYHPFRIKKSNSKNISTQGTSLIRDFSDGKFKIFESKDELSFFPETFFSLLESLRKNLRFYKIGTRLGQQAGKDFIPHHDLFLSNYFNKNNFSCFELDYEDTINFLSKENLSYSPEHKGWGCFTFHNLPLGGFKSVPGRINNYLPKELKIRKKYESNLKFSLFSL